MIKQIKKNISTLVITLIIILPLLNTIIFSVPSADDFSMASDLSINGNYFIKVIKATIDFYNTWGGQWPLIFIEYLLNPLMYAKAYSYAIGIFLIVSFGGFIWLLKRYVDKICVYILGDEKNEYVFIFLVFCLSLFNQRLYSEIFYWFIGNSYLWAVMLLMLDQIVIINFFSRESTKLSIITTSLVGFIACSVYEFDIFLGLFFLIILVISDEKKIYKRYVPFVSMIIGGCVSVFAPGNFARKESLDREISLFKVIYYTEKNIIEGLMEVLANPFTIILLIVTFCVGVMNSKLKRKYNPLWVVVFGVISLVGVVFPVTFGYMSDYTPNRVHFFIDFTILTYVLVGGLYLGAYVSEIELLSKEIVKRNILSVVIVTLVFCVTNIKFYINDNDLDVKMPYIYLIKSAEMVREESEFYKNIFKAIETSAEENVVVSVNSNDYERSWILQNPDIRDDETYWVNESVAKFFGKNSIRVVEQTE
ncbi:DUF6056 family protein [Pseudobutyrivibrio ruminis]|uniref:DUF6056 family protein n=1 Tax=Pseudobutyrivibrio ruminis TaxID=46206 RepID=UPI00041E0A10|nr:DUF6056 family protein [Pseudobutyrivibrio ruminis]